MRSPHLAIGLLLGCSLAGPTLADTSGQQLAERAGQSLIGSPAPPLVLTTIDGQRIDLSKLYGHKAVYLKFWATWCVPCRQQMPHFEHTFENSGSDLAVIAVNAGFNDSIDDVKAYRESVGLKMPIVIDDGRLADALHLRVTPQHIVIGRDGRIVYIGHLVDERLETALQTARAEPVENVAAASDASVHTAALGIGARVPNLSLTAIDGTILSLQDPASQRSTVILFMSPWCESYLAQTRPQRATACKRAREQSEQLVVHSGARWIGIASGLWATTEDLAEYRTQLGVTIPLALDESGALFRRFGVKDVPVFIVVNARGEITGRIDAVSDHLQDDLTKAAGGRSL